MLTGVKGGPITKGIKIKINPELNGLRWTTKQPTEEDYYWCRIDVNDLEPRIVKIRKEDELVAYECGSEIHFSNFEDYEWYGPINSHV